MMLSSLSELLVLLLMAVSVCSREEIDVYRDTVETLRFAQVDPTSIVQLTSKPVRHLANDQYVTGNILYIEGNAIKTVDPDVGEGQLIAGHDWQGFGYDYREGVGDDARFYNPTSLYQLNSTTVIVIDKLNYCVRTLSRITNATSRLAGTCGGETSEFADGTFDEAKFTNIHDVLELPGTELELAIADPQNSRIRKLNMATEQVSTVAELLAGPLNFALNPSKTVMFFSWTNGIGTYDLQTSEVVYLVNRIPVVSDVFPLAFLLLTDSLMLVSQALYKFEIQLLELDYNYDNGTLSRICTPVEESSEQAAGDIRQCKVYKPTPFLSQPEKDRILVGFETSIGSISVTGLQELEMLALQTDDVTDTDTDIGNTNELADGLYFNAVDPESIVSHTSEEVRHLQFDQFIRGNILYIEGNAIKTIDPITGVGGVIAGSVEYNGDDGGVGASARFYNPSSLYQLSKDTVVVIDEQNNCIRKVSRADNLTTTMAGLCHSHQTGHIDGAFLDARFSRIFDVVKLPGSGSAQLAVSDMNNACIRKLNIESEEVSTIVTDMLVGPRSLALNPTADSIFFSWTNGIGTLDLTTNEVVYLVFEIPVLSDIYPLSFLPLTDSLLLIAEVDSKLNLVDLEKNTTTSVCASASEYSEQTAGELTQCKVYEPLSFLLQGEREVIVIGFSNSIGEMNVSGLSKLAFYTDTTEPQVKDGTSYQGMTRVYWMLTAVVTILGLIRL